MKAILMINVHEDFDYRRCSIGGDGNIYYERKDEQRTSIIGNIKNLKPLPQGHGRLIDADAFQKYCFNKNFDKRLSDGGLATINLFLGFQPTIIEADTGEQE